MRRTLRVCLSFIITIVLLFVGKTDGNCHSICSRPVNFICPRDFGTTPSDCYCAGADSFSVLTGCHNTDKVIGSVSDRCARVAEEKSCRDDDVVMNVVYNAANPSGCTGTDKIRLDCKTPKDGVPKLCTWQPIDSAGGYCAEGGVVKGVCLGSSSCSGSGGSSIGSVRCCVISANSSLPNNDDTIPTGAPTPNPTAAPPVITTLTPTRTISPTVSSQTVSISELTTSASASSQSKTVSILGATDTFSETESTKTITTSLPSRTLSISELTHSVTSITRTIESSVSVSKRQATPTPTTSFEPSKTLTTLPSKTGSATFSLSRSRLESISPSQSPTIVPSVTITKTESTSGTIATTTSTLKPITPEPPTTTPEPNTTSPEPPTTTPEPNTTAPEPPTTTPEPNTTAPEPPTTTPQPNTTAPEPPTATPEPNTTAPETPVPTPEPIVPTLELPSPPTPQPPLPTLVPETYAPVPEAPAPGRDGRVVFRKYYISLTFAFQVDDGSRDQTTALVEYAAILGHPVGNFSFIYAAPGSTVWVHSVVTYFTRVQTYEILNVAVGDGRSGIRLIGAIPGTLQVTDEIPQQKPLSDEAKILLPLLIAVGLLILIIAIAVSSYLAKKARKKREAELDKETLQDKYKVDLTDGSFDVLRGIKPPEEGDPAPNPYVSARDALTFTFEGSPTGGREGDLQSEPELVVLDDIGGGGSDRDDDAVDEDKVMIPRPPMTLRTMRQPLRMPQVAQLGSSDLDLDAILDSGAKSYSPRTGPK